MGEERVREGLTERELHLDLDTLLGIHLIYKSF